MAERSSTGSIEVQYFCIDEHLTLPEHICPGSCMFFCEKLPDTVMRNIARKLMRIECPEFYFFGKDALAWECAFDVVAGCEIEKEDDDYVAITVAIKGDDEDYAQDIALTLQSDRIYAFYTKGNEAEIHRTVKDILFFL